MSNITVITPNNSGNGWGVVAYTYFQLFHYFFFYRWSKKQYYATLSCGPLHPSAGEWRECDADFACARDWQLLTWRQAPPTGGWVFTHGCNFRFTSTQKLTYLVFTLIVHVGCQLSFWLENLYFVSEVLFWNKFFFQYFYSSKIFKPYFFFYLSINWGVTFYFYLSTQYQYFAQHCFFVYSDNLLAHRTFKPLRRKVSSLGDTFNIRLQIETLKKNWKFSSLSFTLEHLSSIVRWSNLLDSGGIERKLHM